jgi:hypothetical protein
MINSAEKASLNFGFFHCSVSMSLLKDIEQQLDIRAEADIVAIGLKK